MFISQAAVGQQMKRLEDQLQISLFDRSQKTPRLNALGKALVPKARDIVYQYQTMLDDVAGASSMMGELTLGAIPTMIRGLIPRSIKQLVQTYPQVHIRVVPGLSSDLCEQVERGALDAAVIAKQPVLGNNLVWHPFAEEEMVLLTAPEIESGDVRKLLAEMPYIHLTARAAVAQLADEWLKRNNIMLHAAMEMESLDTLCSMVAHNLGVSIVPNLCVPDPVFEQLRKIPLDRNTSPRKLGLLTRIDGSKLHLTERLLEEMKLTVATCNRHQSP